MWPAAVLTTARWVDCWNPPGGHRRASGVADMSASSASGISHRHHAYTSRERYDLNASTQSIRGPVSRIRTLSFASAKRQAMSEPATPEPMITTSASSGALTVGAHQQGQWVVS